MDVKNGMVLKLLALLLIPITLFSGCDKRKAQLRQTSDTDSTMLEEGRVGDLRLKIYYMSAEGDFFLMPFDVDRLIRASDTQIVIEGEELKAHIDLLKELNAEVLTPVKEKAYLDARLCYIFETTDGEKVLEVASSGVTDSQTDALSELLESENPENIDLTEFKGVVFVNGIAVEHSDILYEVIKPFCTDDIWQKIATYFQI